MRDIDAKYGAGLFDPGNPRDARSERARKILIEAFAENLAALDIKTGEDLQDVCGGLIVGLACCMTASIGQGDHASLRAGMLQLVPWAIDMARSTAGLPPLNDDVASVRAEKP